MNFRALLRIAGFVLASGLVASPQAPTHTPAASAASAVPALVPFAGVVAEVRGNSPGEATLVTFQIFKEESGGEALWTETQTVAVDASGHFAVQMGAASANGIPAEIFQTGEARWLEVQVAGEAPRARILLLSVPYALKAADASTLGGLPASQFATTAQLAATAAALTAQAARQILPETATTGSGITNYLAYWTGGATLGDSVIYQGGTAASPLVGVNTVTPGGTLDVNGSGIFRGTFRVIPATQATATAGVNSPLMAVGASSFDSSVSKPVTNYFSWQAVALGNNTSAQHANMELIYTAGTAVPKFTGFTIAPTGLVTFAAGQTFPGTGTITGVTAGVGLTGGGTAGAVTLKVDSTKVPLLAAANQFTGNQSVAGSVSAMGQLVSTVATGTAPLSVASTTQVANLNASLLGGMPASAFAPAGGAGGFTGIELPDSNGAATGVIAIANHPFLANWGSANGVDAGNTFVGEAGNPSAGGTGNSAFGSGSQSLITGGFSNTSVGASSLLANQTGFYNTAIGAGALYYSTTSYNTAVGSGALNSNLTGVGNTALGYGAGTGGLAGLNNITAIGAGAYVNQSNSLVLGQTNAAYPGNEFVNVGIGTAAPLSVLEASVEAPGKLGPILSLTNPGGGTNAAASVDFRTYLHAATAATPSARIMAIDDNDYGNDLVFQSKTDGADTNGLQTNMEILSYGDVVIKGTLSGAAQQSRIDDPRDPAGKVLVHAAVESSEQMNIYTGNVVTNELGFAVVKLPEWFEAENADFRYQLTVIGRFAQAIVSKEIENNQFTIATNATGVKVSWQVTAVRQDAYAKAHPLVAEQEKLASERGTYLHPELYGVREVRPTLVAPRPPALQLRKADLDCGKRLTEHTEQTAPLHAP